MADLKHKLQQNGINISGQYQPDFTYGADILKGVTSSNTDIDANLLCT